VSEYQISSNNPQKDNFHNIIFVLTKILIFDNQLLFLSTTIVILLFAKGGGK